MEVLAVILMTIGLIAAPVIGFFYPSWRSMNGDEFSERELYGVRAAGIGVLLITFIVSQLIL
ncbi:hypothetical protein GCM10010954_38980 [Halobacillus andaensis]|uniref:Uncharacterized protein n=1 Tax=Halobacillus andaensis TaxID=1176239 RepID=A0A917BBP8_HALAA|nr:hypothetical protein [Halobacillus andaensis]MBP2006727.1 hypothetical protein [Halobacillus andaensis]GGF36190.1 hypothetical protein GCM10010954_38980 [Halobacillus andaensis]